jgi:hypothetical protein
VATIVIGVLASPGLPRDLAEELEEELPGKLAERFEGTSWKIVVGDEPVEGPATSAELLDGARRRLLDEDWDLAICLTDLPLIVGRRPVTAHVSMQHRVGMISVPALGAVRLDERVEEAVVRVIEGLLGETPRRGRRRPGADGRILRRLREISSPLGRVKPKDDRSGFRLVGAAGLGNLRLIAGMVRANDPTLVIVRLSRALAAAVGTGAIALVNSNVWRVADGMGWERLAGVSVAAATATCAALIVSHGLWERAERPEVREKVALFNLATLFTVLIGVVTFHVAVFAFDALCGGALIPSAVFESQLGHPVALGDYLQLAWLTGSLSMIGGALGSVVESDLTVREAAYRYRPTEDHES